jgi:aspartate racemase
VKTLGIVGGIGPESTIEYYRQLIAGFRERNSSDCYPPLLIDSLDVNRLLFFAAKPDRQDLVKYLLDSVSRLARAGADFALLAANTPHLVFPELSAVSPIPLLSIVQATCLTAKHLRLKRVGLFGTRFTMQAGFYQETFSKAEMTVILPNLQEQNYIHERYVQELVSGIILPETRASLLDIVRAMKGRDQIEGLILGGTELPLILRDGAHGVVFLDTTRIHVNFALDRLLQDP